MYCRNSEWIHLIDRVLNLLQMAPRRQWRTNQSKMKSFQGREVLILKRNYHFLMTSVERKIQEQTGGNLVTLEEPADSPWWWELTYVEKKQRTSFRMEICGIRGNYFLCNQKARWEESMSRANGNEGPQSWGQTEAGLSFNPQWTGTLGIVLLFHVKVI